MILLFVYPHHASKPYSIESVKIHNVWVEGGDTLQFKQTN
jgi:hypothetical protein